MVSREVDDHETSGDHVWCQLIKTAFYSFGSSFPKLGSSCFLLKFASRSLMTGKVYLVVFRQSRVFGTASRGPTIGLRKRGTIPNKVQEETRWTANLLTLFR